MAMDAVAKGGRFVQDLIAGSEERKVTLVGLYDRTDLERAWTSEGGGPLALTLTLTPTLALTQPQP